ncbi:TPA: phosphoribosylamine--glycine ligase [candidate division WOR-3 bacterium]|uniref:Phosphoribosylamine--glycine ligase n=1 Tax=candidate division WOR-3 bacterium TaxID=2052148 RepID=A0A350HA07_UNCW3|nr:phosphoribosylamine--glycine ligase [candidate division WOR-3 bacterium]
MKRNALLLGNGGRESAIAYKLNSERVLVHSYPSNPTLSKYCIKADIDSSNLFESMFEYIKSEDIQLVIVGSEAYLADGITDFLESRNIRVFGPSKKAARIESDKSYAKNLMKANNVPTASYDISESKEDCIEKSKKYSFPLVLKVSGLAAGKGAFVIKNKEEFDGAIKEIFDTKQFEKSNSKVVIEEFMNGEEASLFVITDGENILTLPPAQDFKRVYDNDMGLNTGGMGSYAPCGLLSKSLEEKTIDTIILPVLNALKRDKNPFKGVLFAGLMIDGNNVKVVEFNARFGDPEIQSIMSVIESSMYDIFMETAEGNLRAKEIETNGFSAVTVVVAANGYPGDYKKNIEISLDENKFDKNTLIFYAGAKEEDGKILSTGGRMLDVTSFDIGLEKAIDRVYSNLNKIQIEGSFYRKDIGKKGLKYAN